MEDEGSSSDLDFRINEGYAKNYNNWRKKEELRKLKDRYGSGTESESSSEDESDDEIAPQLDKEFFRTLSYLKGRNPKIYNKNVEFFAETDGSQNNQTKKKKKERPMYLKDYERHIILEKEGQLTDEDVDEVNLESIKKSSTMTYVEEQNEIKESFKKTLQDDDDDDDDELLVERKKTAEEEAKEQEEYIDWLKGQRKDIDDDETKKEMKSLQEFWNKPDIDPAEAYLKDYILNKRYLEDNDKNRIPTYDEVVHDSEDLSEDEKTLEKQSLFEHKYNFRYEEPDPEFIKHYPRTLQDSLRRKDEKRKKKREELKDRKKKEKELKQEELKRLKSMKRTEIIEKLEKLKEITGNSEIGFNDEDLEKDFDPQEYDKKMNEIFNEEYYETNVDSERPEFTYDDELDDEEDWDNWCNSNKRVHDAEGPHCEDPDFNMDADYDPRQDLKQSILEMSKKKKKKRKSKFAEVVNKRKPIFTPDEKTFEEYIDEYYKLDYEDLIGDMPCRFKYRKVKPNDFGLSINEILSAKDGELNQWASLKKTSQFRSEEEERYDLQAFQKKSNNLERKKRILSSIYELKEEEEEEECRTPSKKKKKETLDAEVSCSSSTNDFVKLQSKSNPTIEENLLTRKPFNNEKKRKKKNQNFQQNSTFTDERLKAYGINPKKYKKKFKK